MDWFTAGKTSEAKRHLAHLSDPTKRERAARDLIGLGAEAVPVLLDALQTRDISLLPFYRRILSASPTLTKTLATAHPIIRACVAEIFSIKKDTSAVPVLLEALRA